MSIFNNMLSFFGLGSLQRNVGPQFPTPTGYTNTPASPVTEDTALQVSAVWACARLLAETVASLPLCVYAKSSSGRERDDGHWFAQLMARKVNRYQTRVEFFETVMLNLVLHGNAYCLIQRTGNRITSLLPLMSAQVETRLQPDGSVLHYYLSSAGLQVFAAESIWHLKYRGNGIVGLSPLAYGRNLIGVAQSAEQAVTNIYANGGKPSGVLVLDRLLKPEQRAEIRANFSTLTTGNNDRLLVLEQGMKFEAISLSPQDIELLASRRFQIEEICRWFGVPSVLVNDTSSSTAWGSGIEQIVAGFYKLNVRPQLERIEASIEGNLWTPADVVSHEVEFDFDSLLRADQGKRFEIYKNGVLSGVMTPNEARAEEAMPAKPGGDSLLAPVNMLPIEKLGQQPRPLPGGFPNAGA